VPSFNSEDTIGGQNLNKMGHVNLIRPRPLGGSLSSKADILNLHTKFGNSRFSRSGLRTSKIKMGHVTLTMPLWGVLCHPKART